MQFFRKWRWFLMAGVLGVSLWGAWAWTRPPRINVLLITLDTTRADATIEDAIDTIEHDRVRRIPVVDERDRLVGIIAQADIALRVGPKEPRKIETLLEHISEPTASTPRAGGA